MAKSRKSAGGVTSLLGELPLLSAVAANPADDHLKLVYADWLEERGDPRGPFLRRFIQAVQGGQALPRGRGVPAAWQEMAGLSLLRRLCEGGLAEHRATVMALAQPALAMEAKASPEGRIPVGATKFGGRPDLPAGAKWPRSKRGPLEFLAQLDLAEFRQTVAGQVLPPAGLLSFFMYHNYPDDEYGNGRDEPPGRAGGVRVIHTPDTATLVRLDPPDDLDEDLGRPRRPGRVTFREVLDLPEPGDDFWSERYGAAAARLAEMHDSDADRLRRAGHQLFGYARVTVLGRDPIPGPGWQHLIRFGSDDALGWGWGDGHHLFWYIKASDLKRGRFDRTWATDG